MSIIHYTVHSIQRALYIYGVHNTARKIDEVLLGWTKEETICCIVKKRRSKRKYNSDTKRFYKISSLSVRESSYEF